MSKKCLLPNSIIIGQNIHFEDVNSKDQLKDLFYMFNLLLNISAIKLNRNDPERDVFNFLNYGSPLSRLDGKPFFLRVLQAGS